MSTQVPNLAPKPETDDLKTTFERVDNRWDPRNARRDWIVILVLIIIYVIWASTLYLFEPGIR